MQPLSNRTTKKTAAKFIIFVVAILLLSAAFIPFNNIQPQPISSAPLDNTWPYLKEWNNLDIQYPAELTYSYPIETNELAVCLSGGGYRAALFHTGVLARLNTMGLLQDIRRIVGVSGGSIPATLLGAYWSELIFDHQSGVATNFHSVITQKVIELSSHTLDTKSVLYGFLPWTSSGEVLTQYYDEYLFNGKTLADLPSYTAEIKSGLGPEVVVLATELRTRSQWVFTKYVTGSVEVGYIPYPEIPLSTVVAASAAYPPFLAPIMLKANPIDFWNALRAPSNALPQFENTQIFEFFINSSKEKRKLYLKKWQYDLKSKEIFKPLPENKESFFKRPDLSSTNFSNIADLSSGIFLIDGGILSNTGSELCTNSNRFIVSSAGIHHNSLLNQPKNWLDVTIATTETIHDRAEKEEFQNYREHLEHDTCADTNKIRCGDYVSLSSYYVEYYLSKKIRPPSQIKEYIDSISIPTRLDELDTSTAERIVNWGYLSGLRFTMKFGDPNMKEETIIREIDNNIPFPNEW